MIQSSRSQMRQRAYISAQREFCAEILRGENPQGLLPPKQRMTAQDARDRLLELEVMESDVETRFSATAVSEVYAMHLCS